MNIPDTGMESPRVRVVLTGALLRLFPGARSNIDVRAATVDELLSVLDRQWPGMRDRLTDTTPGIRRHINIFVDGKRASLETPLVDGATVYVLTAMSGG
ncbi:MAG: MoaD/ThiS family protein [Pseudomonadota bacterium]